MNILVILLMAGMSFVGVRLILIWDPMERMKGIATLLGVGLAAFLFLTQWLPVQQNTSFGLIVIAALTVTGNFAGRALAALVSEDWLDDLIEVRPFELSPVRRPTSTRDL